MKKCISIITVVVMSLLTSTALAGNVDYTLGSYYQLGRYNNEPIIWRCVSTDDENGVLMVSDKVLCFKPANAGPMDSPKSLSCKDIYGNNFWEETTIRAWLNSTADSGNVQWPVYPPDEYRLPNKSYDSEAGFLYDDNFSASEKSVMKSVSQWQALPGNKLSLTQNGTAYQYIINYGYPKGHGEYQNVGRLGLEDLKDGFKGAMYRLSDTVFLMNEPQAAPNSVYQIFL